MQSVEPVPPGKSTVLVVDDHPLLRHGLARLIDREERLEVCGEAADAPSALAAFERLAPDVVVVDVSLNGHGSAPDTSGIDVLRTMLSLRPGLPVLVLSMHEESTYAYQALRAGARGYVSKAEPMDHVVQALYAVLDGGTYLSRCLASDLDLPVPDEEDPAFDLTKRERQIVRLVGQGLRCRQVAAHLGLSPKTVNAHRENIKRKLGLPSAAALDQFAIRWVHRRPGHE